jgi:uncharacterized protein YjbJ (UPF0337 family)
MTDRHDIAVARPHTPGMNMRKVDMTDEHIKGAVSKAKGTIEEGLGKLTHNRKQQAHGKATQVQGAAQSGLGDVQDKLRRPKAH